MFRNSIGDITAFIIIGQGSDQFYLLAYFIICPQIFRDLVLVITDNFIGYIQDALCTTVVLLQLDHFYIVIVVLKLEDVLNCRTAEGVDTLCIITHHTDIFRYRSQHFYNFILCGIGILVLIDHYILELVLVFSQYFRLCFQQFVHFKQQVIKVHCTVFKTAAGVLCIELPCERTVGARIFLGNRRFSQVLRRPDQAVLGTGDTA
ncbi:hypothetical protein D9M68_727250 [compost metagenome]